MAASDGTRAVLRPHTSRVKWILPRSSQKGGLATLTASQFPRRNQGHFGFVSRVPVYPFFRVAPQGGPQRHRQEENQGTHNRRNGTPHPDKNLGTPTQRLSSSLPDQRTKVAIEIRERNERRRGTRGGNCVEERTETCTSASHQRNLLLLLLLL